MKRQFKSFVFLMVSRSEKIQVNKTFIATDGENMTAKSRAILIAKKWGKENGFKLKTS